MRKEYHCILLNVNSLAGTTAATENTSKQMMHSISFIRLIDGAPPGILIA
jgi:hypothetical protein